MAAEPAVRVQDLTKVFRIPFDRHHSLKASAVNLFRNRGHRRLEALKGVSFEVAQGEFFSIVGSNGSGKSSLLKILAGIYQPTSGSVWTRGRLSPFIELGVGFNPELTARDNIFLNGAILGLSRRQVAALFDEIIAFAELEEFVDQKVKNYSSGMLVRLAFSIAIRAHADILLVDEVLAVGDSNFQQKCFDVFSRLKAEGRTILFVSHDLGSVREFSDRVMVLDGGVNHGVFSSADAISEYSRLNERRLAREMERTEKPGLASAADGRPAVRSVEVRSQGERSHIVHAGDRVEVVVEVDNPRCLPLQLGVAISRLDGLYCFGTNTFIAGWQPVTDRRFTAEVVYDPMPLRKGSYYLTIGLFGERETTVHEMIGHAFEFQVSSQDRYEGIVSIPHSWKRLG